MLRNITPCAFWPTAPVEAPTTIGNPNAVLMVGADGDPAAPFPGQQVAAGWRPQLQPVATRCAG